MTQTHLKPTRRTVIRTAAWTAPAVSLAVAAPAFAASGLGPVSPVGSPTSSQASANDKNAIVVSTTLNSKAAVSGTVTAAVQVQVFKDSGAALATATVSHSAGEWSGPSGSIPTFQRNGLPAGTSTFAPTISLGAGSWNSFQVTITFSGPGFPTFSVVHTYAKP